MSNVGKSGKLGAIIRELNKRYDAFLNAFEEDKYKRAKNISLYICINNRYTRGEVMDTKTGLDVLECEIAQIEATVFTLKRCLQDLRYNIENSEVEEI